jgi:photosystem II stability/assembly factor-like uncharacterized protein
MKKNLFSTLILTIFSISAFSQWVNQTSGVTSELSDVFFVNQQIGYTSTNVIGQNYILKTTNNGNTWSQLAQSNQGALCLHFMTEDTGIVTKGSSIYKTTNGATSLQFITTLTSSGFIFGIDFPNKNIGYAAGSNSTIGFLYKTLNGGNTWTNITPALNVGYRSVSFSSVDTGYIVGTNGYIQKTVDGGATWTQLNSGSTTYLNSVYFRPHSKNGWIVGGLAVNSGIILMTNNGTTWSNVTPTGGCPVLQSISFVDDNNGYAVGLLGVIYKTTDGGLTWTQEVGSGSANFNSVHYLDINNAWAVGAGGVIKHVATTVNLNEEENKQYIIYPNPMASSAVISFESYQEKTSIKIFDLMGKEIQSSIFSGTDFLLEKANLKIGVYFIQITNSGNEVSRRKIIVE